MNRNNVWKQFQLGRSRHGHPQSPQHPDDWPFPYDDNFEVVLDLYKSEILSIVAFLWNTQKLTDDLGGSGFLGVNEDDFKNAVYYKERVCDWPDAYVESLQVGYEISKGIGTL